MDDLRRFLKGFAMGAANVIPGVSGGTIAFITGIYERLIDALKKVDTTTIRLLCRLRIGEAWIRMDGRFLAALAIGAGLSIISLARALEWCFEHYPVLVWAFFFGLIAASLPAVARLVSNWTPGPVIAFLSGTGIALSTVLMTPASENDNPFYLGICGVVATCSMIIPGLSGSYVLLLMGNYKVIMIDAVNDLSGGEIGPALQVLVPVGTGAVIGMLVLARLLSWLFHRWHDVAVAAISGFVSGSLVVIWPWKDTLKDKFVQGEEVTEKIRGFANWHLPDPGAGSTWAALGAVLGGVAVIALLEYCGGRERRNEGK